MFAEAAPPRRPIKNKNTASPKQPGPTKNHRPLPEQTPTITNAQEEAHLRVLRAIEANRSSSQRDRVEQLGISLGKTNYCLQALMEKGWIKAKNFKNSKNKIAYSLMRRSPTWTWSPAVCGRRMPAT